MHHNRSKHLSKEVIKALSDEELDNLMFKMDESLSVEKQMLHHILTERNRRKRLQEEKHSEQVKNNTERLITRFDRIISLLSHLLEKPGKSFVYAVIFAIVTGTFINVLTPLTERFINWLLCFVRVCT